MRAPTPARQPPQRSRRTEAQGKDRRSGPERKCVRTQSTAQPQRRWNRLRGPGQAHAFPDADGLPLDADALEFLATDATARAHAYLSALHTDITTPSAASPAYGPTPAARPDKPPTSGISPFPDLTPWQDGIRLAATAHPTAGLTATTRALYRDLAAATGRSVTDVARAVGHSARPRTALTPADLPPPPPRHNHLTDPARGIQLRFGHDNRWYPYESDPGAEDWWPTGRADPDPVGALTALLGR
ncbi:hypothetical protein [Streptomyces rimosus]